MARLGAVVLTLAFAVAVDGMNMCGGRPCNIDGGPAPSSSGPKSCLALVETSGCRSFNDGGKTSCHKACSKGYRCLWNEQTGECRNSQNQPTAGRQPCVENTCTSEPILFAPSAEALVSDAYTKVNTVDVEVFLERHAFSCANALASEATNQADRFGSYSSLNLRGFVAADAQLTDMGMQQSFDARASYFGTKPDDYFDFAGVSAMTRATETALLSVPPSKVRGGQLHVVPDLSEARNPGSDYDNQPPDKFHHQDTFCYKSPPEPVGGFASVALNCPVKPQRWYASANAPVANTCECGGANTAKVSELGTTEMLELNYLHFGSTGNDSNSPEQEEFFFELVNTYIPAAQRDHPGGKPIRLVFTGHSNYIKEVVQHLEKQLSSEAQETKKMTKAYPDVPGLPKPVNTGTFRFDFTHTFGDEDHSPRHLVFKTGEQSIYLEHGGTDSTPTFVEGKKIRVPDHGHPCGAARCYMMWPEGGNWRQGGSSPLFSGEQTITDPQGGRKTVGYHQDPLSEDKQAVVREWLRGKSDATGDPFPHLAREAKAAATCLPPPERQPPARLERPAGASSARFRSRAQAHRRALEGNRKLRLQLHTDVR